MAGLLKAAGRRLLGKLMGLALGAALLLAAVLAFSLFSDSKGIALLEVGECFVIPDSSGTFSSVDVPGCDESHDAQVFSLFDGEGLTDDEVSSQCAASLASVGFPGPQVAVDVRSFSVSRKATPRHVICFVAHPALVTEPALVFAAE